MNELAGLNTRLDGKEKYEKLNNQYLNDRRNQSCDIIQPSNNVFNNYENVKNNYEKYSRSEYKNIMESEFNKKQTSYNDEPKILDIKKKLDITTLDTNSVNCINQIKHDKTAYGNQNNLFIDKVNTLTLEKKNT